MRSAKLLTISRVGSAKELRRRVVLSVARMAANFNDLEMAANYTLRLEANFLKEVDAGYLPEVRETGSCGCVSRG